MLRWWRENGKKKKTKNNAPAFTTAEKYGPARGQNRKEVKDGGRRNDRSRADQNSRRPQEGLAELHLPAEYRPRAPGPRTSQAPLGTGVMPLDTVEASRAPAPAEGCWSCKHMTRQLEERRESTNDHFDGTGLSGRRRPTQKSIPRQRHRIWQGLEMAPVDRIHARCGREGEN